MDDGRIPIDLTEEHAPAEDDARSYVREDGTLVIDILVDPSCGATADGRIIVCAPGQSPYRYEPPLVPADDGLKPEVQLGDNAKVAASVESGLHGSPQATIALKIKF